MKNIVNIRKGKTVGSSTSLHKTTQVFIIVLIFSSLMTDVIDVFEAIFIHYHEGDYQDTNTTRNAGCRDACNEPFNFLLWSKRIKSKIRILTPVSALGECNGKTIAKENIEPLATRQSKVISAESSVDKNQTSSEWIFSSITSGDVLTLEFNEFQLEGPECNQNITG